MEFWLISVPGEKTPEQAFQKLEASTNRELSSNFRFHVPELKVGTLDELVRLSDELAKLDQYCEGVVQKLGSYLAEIMENSADVIRENLKANDKDLATYLMKFSWDSAKYPVKYSLRNLTEIISKQMTTIEGELKTKASTYNSLKNNLESLRRKQTGSLLTRNLHDLVKREHFVIGSDYLTTLVVVVAKGHHGDWMVKYQELNEYVVPGSSQMIYEDQEACLVTVTLFHKVVDEFKHKCREHKFVVRDFTYDEVEMEKSKNELKKLTTDKEKQYKPLFMWLKVNFSEAFTAWTHVKALRIFVESVLRYGLPVNFQAILMCPVKGKQKRLRDTLQQLYAHLDSSGSDMATGDFDVPGAVMPGLGQEYYPYVLNKIVFEYPGSSSRAVDN